MSKHQDIQPEVAAIITAMTDGEQPFVRDTIKSVLSDPVCGQILLCIDQANTWIHAELGEIAADPGLELIQMPLAPLGAVRNQALKYVKMPWVAYCDGDDVWCQGKTLIQLTYAKTTEYDFVGADHYLTNEQGQIRAFAPARYIPMPSSWMVRTQVMKQHPFTEAPYSLGPEDGEWWIRTEGLVRKARCPQMLLRYRIRPNSLSAKTPSMQRKAKTVALGNIPVLGAIILMGTWAIWLCTRQQAYIWNRDWGQKPSNHKDLEIGNKCE